MTVSYDNPLQEGVAVFMRACDQPDLLQADREPVPLPIDRHDLRLKLIREEGIVELSKAVMEQDLVEAIDALIDTVYVTLGAGVEMGRDFSYAVATQMNREEKDLLSESEILFKISHHAGTITTMYGFLAHALRRFDDKEARHWLARIIQIALGAFKDFGLDPQPFFDEVQRANMSKLDPKTGKAILGQGEDVDGHPLGKVLKGPNYRAPDLESIYRRMRNP